MTLSELKDGTSAVVLQLNNSPEIKTKLNKLGVVVGVKLLMIRRAPLGDPIEIKVRDFYLAIRKSEAVKIIVEQK